MSLAIRLRWYLDSHGIDYEIVRHSHSNSSADSGKKAHVPTGRVVKSVLLEDERGYVLANVPAACRISFGALHVLTHRNLEIASESETEDVFMDCERGAVPAVGDPYNIPMVVDDSLLRMPDVYLEGGDHRELVHLNREAFRTLMERAAHGCIIGRPH
jgi:Ala-tRNA(Pro) deacylase